MEHSVPEVCLEIVEITMSQMNLGKSQCKKCINAYNPTRHSLIWYSALSRYRTWHVFKGTVPPWFRILTFPLRAFHLKIPVLRLDFAVPGRLAYTECRCWPKDMAILPWKMGLRSGLNCLSPWLGTQNGSVTQMETDCWATCLQTWLKYSPNYNQLAG